MRNESEIKTELNDLNKERNYQLALRAKQTSASIAQIHYENSLLLRGKILGLQWVLRSYKPAKKA